MIPQSLVIQELERWPARLPGATLEVLSALPAPEALAGGDGSGGRLASIVIVTFNGLPFTKLCLHSLAANTVWRPYEVVFVDNGSTDGTAEWLSEVVSRSPSVRLLKNAGNEGFACAANRGLGEADGDILVLLNNDTVLTPGWLTRLVRCLDESHLGMVGPVTNRCGNEAEVEAPYQSYGDLLGFAHRRAETHAGESLELPMLSLFCAAWTRRVLDEAGLLDERFEVGTYEDDDYSMRVRRAGYRLACADDCFIHHFGQVTFGQLGDADNYQQQLRTNRRRFEEKWGISWTPHRRRQYARYQQLCHQIQQLAHKKIPADARVLVVSKGDEDLLELLGPGYSHFPQDESGQYAGHHPADSRDAVARLEALIASGAEYLLFPQTAFWWLDYYPEFREFLEKRARLLAAELETAQIFFLLATKPEERGPRAKTQRRKGDKGNGV